MSIEIAKPKLLKHHDALTHGMRWGVIHSNGDTDEHSGGCFAGSTHTLLTAAQQNASAVYVIFHGDGADITVEELCDPVKYNKKMASQTRPWNKFEGTERSKIWVSFLMSEASPWAALHPFILEKDEDYINGVGFLFTPKNVPVKLWYNFVMAVRYPWEQAASYSTMLHLIERGIEPNTACFISNSFFLKAGASGLDGPWDIQYPMSYLEQLTLEAAGRFILGKPGCLSSTGSPSPNCGPLWDIGDEKLSLANNRLAEKLSEKSDLMLSDIVSTVEGVVAQHKEILK